LRGRRGKRARRRLPGRALERDRRRAPLPVALREPHAGRAALPERAPATLLAPPAELRLGAGQGQGLRTGRRPQMTLTPLAGLGSRRAKPGSAAAWRRWRQDPARSALVRAPWHCPARLALASLASDAPGT